MIWTYEAVMKKRYKSLYVARLFVDLRQIMENKNVTPIFYSAKVLSLIVCWIYLDLMKAPFSRPELVAWVPDLLLFILALRSRQGLNSLNWLMPSRRGCLVCFGWIEVKGNLFFPLDEWWPQRVKLKQCVLVWVTWTSFKFQEVLYVMVDLFRHDKPEV